MATLYHTLMKHPLGKQPAPRIAAMLLMLFVLEWYFSPLQICVTTLHEGAHWLAVYLTGGRVVAAFQSGTTGHVRAHGGWPATILFVGYACPLMFTSFLVGNIGRKRLWHALAAFLFAVSLVDIAQDYWNPGPNPTDMMQLAEKTGIKSIIWLAIYLCLGATCYALGHITRAPRCPTKPHPKKQRQ